MRRLVECPTLDEMLKITESSVQIRVQLVGDGSKRQNGGVPGGWGLFRLKFTRATPSQKASRSAQSIQLFRLGHCPTLDTMLRDFKLLVQKTDDVRLGLTRLKGEVL